MIRERLAWAWCLFWARCGGVGVPGVVTGDGCEMCQSCYEKANTNGGE